MGGGPVIMDGDGLGANAPKNKLAGVIIVRADAASRRRLLRPRRQAGFAAFGGILYGYDTGVISGIQTMDPWLRQYGHPVPVSETYPGGYGLTSGQQSLVVSILSVGTFIGKATCQ
jgi:SP family sugar:H+ symporter-like MFS transporter